MQTFYKVFLVLFIAIIAVNLYAFDYRTDFRSEDNMKFIISIAFGIIGIALLFVLNTWSKIKVKK